MKRKEQKERIIKAARICFARYGYEKTTMEDIGRQVGLNKASLYHYFKNGKDSVFNEVFLSEKADYFDAVRLKLKKVKTCSKKIFTYLEERLYFFLKIPIFASLTIETVKKKQPTFEKISKFFSKLEIDFLSDLLQECIDNGEIIECDSELIAQSIITIADAIKMKIVKDLDVIHIRDINFPKINEEIIYTVSLILNGLKK